jgi:predicted dehydrogenase
MSRVAIIGCGAISPRYAKTLNELGSVTLAAVADGIPERAQALATEHGAAVMTVDEILADTTIDAVVNLTPPLAHGPVTRSILQAGKAAFSEKPLAVDMAEGQALVELAAAQGVRFGCAPDTFLGAGLQLARAAIDRGDIGVPLAATGFFLGFGPEYFLPNPNFFYEHGGGPLLDMGPYYLTALVQLLGPAVAVTASGRISRAQRPIMNGERLGEMMDVSVLTHVSSVVEFASGPLATLVTSFDVAATDHRNIEIYGSEGTLSVPDPNFFGGAVRVKRFREEEWTELDPLTPNVPQQRGIGLADMMWAQRTGRPHRASATLALHVLDIMTSALSSVESGQKATLSTTCERAEPMRFDLPDNTFDD